MYISNFNMTFMKQLIRIISFFFISAVASSLESCDREIDYNAFPGFQRCKIHMMIEHGSSTNDTAIVKYDGSGNPRSIKMNLPRTGHPNFVFTYDRLHRLTECAQIYDNGNFENWHKYGLNATGQIVQDTVYTFGAYNGGRFPSDYMFKRVHQYTYDAVGRIIQTQTTSLFPADSRVSTERYTYDARGNL